MSSYAVSVIGADNRHAEAGGRCEIDHVTLIDRLITRKIGVDRSIDVVDTEQYTLPSPHSLQDKLRSGFGVQIARRNLVIGIEFAVLQLMTPTAMIASLFAFRAADIAFMLSGIISAASATPPPKHRKYSNSML